MKSTNETRAGVWMDHHHAYIVTRNSQGQLVHELVGKEQDAHHHGNETSEQAREAHLRTFFKQVEDKLHDHNHIFLCGPGTACSEFHHHLAHVRSFTGKRIAEEKAAKMTMPQLFAYMEKKLDKPMDIIRPDEVL